ncbi:MAG TPA: adenylate/guanylate cyclase domain-containing protein [Chthoniobacteraceae bacterium]|nr:adenylate/guanylate cyclase domain-containing protein [Chthoniobacteraceae bacterium]
MRYLKATIIVGLLVGGIVAVLIAAHAFARLDLALAQFLKLGAPGPGNPILQYSLAAALALAIAWTTIDIPRPSLKNVVAFGAFMEVIAATAILKLFGQFFSPFASLAAIAGSFVLGFLYSRSEAGSRKRILRQILGDRVSERTFKNLIDSAEPLNLEGERRDVTIVVCEIFNHDELEDALPAPDYVALTNSFRRNVADLLVERGGYLDECDGESVRVVFGAPHNDVQHASTACESALALEDRLNAVNRECHTIWKQMFDFRIGVNSGEMVLGAYGSRRLGNYSVAGEPVEFGRRLCRANLIYGSRILLGAGTFFFAEPAIEVRPMEMIQRYEDGSREEIYELLGMRDVLSFDELERRDLFWKGVVFYREQLWDEALDLFYSARAPKGADGPVEFYIRRIEQMRTGLAALDWNSARL